MTNRGRLSGGVSSLVDPQTRRYLGHSEVTLGPRTRLVIAAIADPRTIDELRPDAAVERMLPHDALLVLERTDPDLVLVDTAALLPGRPWAHGGDPSAGDRGRRLFEILGAAHALGRPTVLWWNGPRDHAVGLIPLEPSFDLVITNERSGADDTALPWTTGVQLRTWNPLGGDPDGPRHPVFLWRRGTITSRTAGPTGTILLALAGAGLEIWRDADEPPGGVPVPNGLRSALGTPVDPERLPDRFREHGLFLAGPIASAEDDWSIGTTILQQLAGGGRLVSGRNEGLEASFGAVVQWMGGPAGALDAVRDAASRGPMSGGELRTTLRTLHRDHATSVALATLARYLGLRGQLTPNRDVCAVVSLAGDVRGTDFVDSILRQDQRPAEALLVTEDTAAARPLLMELAEAGIRGHVAPPPDPREGILRRAAGFVGSGWIWAWAPEQAYPPTFLLDCLVGGQMAGAAAVGPVDGRVDRFVDDLPVTRAIVSREAARSRPDPHDGHLAPWARRGAPLFGMAALAAEGA